MTEQFDFKECLFRFMNETIEVTNFFKFEIIKDKELIYIRKQTERVYSSDGRDLTGDTNPCFIFNINNFNEISFKFSHMLSYTYNNIEPSYEIKKFDKKPMEYNAFHFENSFFEICKLPIRFHLSKNGLPYAICLNEKKPKIFYLLERFNIDNKLNIHYNDPEIDDHINKLYKEKSPIIKKAFSMNKMFSDYLYYLEDLHGVETNRGYGNDHLKSKELARTECLDCALALMDLRSKKEDRVVEHFLFHIQLKKPIHLRLIRNISKFYTCFKNFNQHDHWSYRLLRSVDLFRYEFIRKKYNFIFRTRGVISFSSYSGLNVNNMKRKKIDVLQMSREENKVLILTF